MAVQDTLDRVKSDFRKNVNSADTVKIPYLDPLRVDVNTSTMAATAVSSCLHLRFRCEYNFCSLN